MVLLIVPKWFNDRLGLDDVSFFVSRCKSNELKQNNMQYVQISGGENISSSLKWLLYLIFDIGGIENRGNFLKCRKNFVN